MAIDPIVISDRIQTLQGRVFRRRPNGYYQCGGYPLLLHREVWKANTGSVPPGKKTHVHHVNGNKDDNTFANLQLMTTKAHIQEHFEDPVRRAQARKNMLENVMPAARAWHSSPEGLAWHAKHGAEVAAGMALKPLQIRVCEFCGIDFSTRRKIQRFCGPNCKASANRARRAAGVPINERRNCVGKSEAKAKTCGDCGGEYMTRSGRSQCCPPCRMLRTNKRARDQYEHKGLATGDRNGARLHPDKLARGATHSSATRPETVARGERSARSKLTTEKVIAIRTRAAAGEDVNALAAEFGIKWAAAHRVINRKTWAHVP